MATQILKDIVKAGTTSTDIAKTNASKGVTQESNVGTSATSQGRIFMSQPAKAVANPTPTTQAVKSANSVTGVLQKGVATPTPISSTLPGASSPTVASATPQVSGTTPSATPQVSGTTPSAAQASDTTAVDKAYTDWAAKQRAAGVAEQDISRSIFEAGGQAEITNQSKAAQSELDWGSELTPEPTQAEIKMYGSYQNAVKQKLLLKQEGDRLQAETAKKNEEAITASQAKRENTQSQAAISSMQAQTAQDREGGQSSSNAMVAPAFAADTNAKLTENSIQRANLQAQRDQVYQSLLDAQKNQRGDEADAFAKQVSAIDAQITKSEADNAALNKNAADTVFQFLQASPSAFAGMDASTIAQNFGVDFGTATALSNFASAMVKTPEYASTLSKQAEALRQSTMDINAKQIDMAQKLFDMGDVESANKIIKSLNLDGTSWHDGQTQNYNSGTSSMDSHFGDSGVVIPPSSKYLVTTDNSGGISIDVPTDANGVCINGRGQCGEFVNDYLGSKVFGDTYQSKLAKVNSDTPAAGSAFVMDTGLPYGHTGVVTKVYADGSIDIMDSNRHGNEKLDTGHIDNPASAGIVGYYNPILNRQGSKFASIATKVSETSQQETPASNSPLNDPTEEQMAEDYALGNIKMSDITEYAKSQMKSSSKAISAQEMKTVQDNILTRAAQKKEQYGNPQSIADLPSDIQMSVKGLLDFSGQLTDFTTRKEGGLKRSMLNVIQKIDPTWTVADYENRQQVIKSFQGGPENEKTDLMNAAVGDIAQLSDLTTKIGQMGIADKLFSPDRTATNSYESKANDVQAKLNKVKELGGQKQGGLTVGSFLFGSNTFSKWDNFTNAQKKIDDTVSSMVSEMETQKQHYESILKKPIPQILSKQNFDTLKSLHTQGYVSDYTWARVVSANGGEKPKYSIPETAPKGESTNPFENILTK